MKNKKVSVTIIINIKLKFVQFIVLPKVYLNLTSVLAIKTSDKLSCSVLCPCDPEVTWNSVVLLTHTIR